MKRRVRGQKIVLMSVLGWANLRYHLWNWAIGMPLMLSIGAVSYAGLPNSPQNEWDLMTLLQVSLVRQPLAWYKSQHEAGTQPMKAQRVHSWR
jgi:hypothetical protein